MNLCSAPPGRWESRVTSQRAPAAPAAAPSDSGRAGPGTAARRFVIIVFLGADGCESESGDGPDGRDPRGASVPGAAACPRGVY